MAQEVLIVGASGTGKSTSIENLNPESTFIVNVARKALPFRGWKSKYPVFNKENPKGNFCSTDVPHEILGCLNYINDKRLEIKTIVIDDYQYTMANEYMRRASETGFKKFTEIAQNAWSVINAVKAMRDDLLVVFMMHSEVTFDAHGNKVTKAKTIGKMMDNVITLEGMFTIVLYTDVLKGENGMEYSFITQNDGTNTGKAPKDMFGSVKIPNDLVLVADAIEEYNN
jgi:ABC-type dipeptide/oligopeptide/nickel transport system ATPase component|tara:strand:+ start:380 stop:1060 length:681 start_codon:yes stop_codon:yes gene_type:complete